MEETREYKPIEPGQLPKILRSVGKRCFAYYYFTFRHVPDNPWIVNWLQFKEGYTYNSSHVRTSISKRIIHNGLSEEALDLIINAKKVSDDTRNVARNVAEYLKHFYV